MGYKNRAEAETETCLSEALLFATMCIIGLPVDVHLRDGSVYSGTFYTASADKEYGIVLKKAKLTKKGKCDANVVNGSVIETLVILSGDLVQVVAKGILFPADIVLGNVASDDVEATLANVSSCGGVMTETKESNRSSMDKNKVNENRISTKSKNNSANGFMPTKAGMEHEGGKFSLNHTGTATELEHGRRDGINISKSEEVLDASVIGRQIGDDGSGGEQDYYKKKFGLQREKNDDEVQSSSSKSSSCSSEAKAVEEGKIIVNLLPNGVSGDPTPAVIKPDSQCCGRSGGTSSPTAVCSSISTASTPLVNVTSESHCSLSSLADVVSPQISESTKSTKEFKLNPGAKLFCPSFATSISATTAVPAVASMAFVPSNSPMVSVAAAAQPEIEISSFLPRPSVPAKFSPYTNIAAVNGGTGSQFSQPNVGQMGNRTQPLRYGSQYHAIQAAPAYVPPNSQAVMVGRLGQFVYVQPVAHDLVNSTATISSVSARPLLGSNQIPYPKHQGTAAGQALQLCAPPPFVAGGHHPFPMPSNIPLLQPPIPANRPIPIPGSNALFSTKFP